MDNLQLGIDALKAGKRDEARKFLAVAIKGNADNERAWQWMYNAANNDMERIQCLEQILRVNPQNKTASEKHWELSQATSKALKLPESKDLDDFGDKLGNWVNGSQEWSEMDNYAAKLEKRKAENAPIQELINTSLKKCPYCAEMIQAEANVCKHCGKTINFTTAEKLNAVGKSMNSLGNMLIVFVTIPICLCFLLIFLSSLGQK